MEWLSNVKTRTKLFLGFGVMLVLLGAVLVVSYRALVRIQENELEIERNSTTASEITAVHLNQRQIRIGAFQMISTKDPEKLARLREEGDDLIKDNARLLRVLVEQEGNHAGLGEDLKECAKELTDFAEARNKDVVPPILAGNVDAAVVVLQTTQAKREETINDLGLGLGKEIAKHSSDEIAES